MIYVLEAIECSAEIIVKAGVRSALRENTFSSRFVPERRKGTFPAAALRPRFAEAQSIVSGKGRIGSDREQLPGGPNSPC